MKRLVLLTLGLAGCLVVLLITTLAYARRSSATQVGQVGFTLCDGYPCYDGITPGLTTWAQAKMIFSEAARESLNSNFSILTLDENSAPISFYSHGSMVGFIGANYWKAKTPITVGQLMIIFGLPCAVRMVVDDRGTPTFIQALHYPTTTVFVSYAARLTPQASVTLINVYKPSLGSQCYAGADSQTALAPWEGFATAPHYTSLPTTNMLPAQLN
jgi:hypothetical protein